MQGVGLRADHHAVRPLSALSLRLAVFRDVPGIGAPSLKPRLLALYLSGQ